MYIFIHTPVRNTIGLILLLSILGCKDSALNDPYPQDPPLANIYYSSFAERPKNLDPARSYSAGEWALIAQIYEPPLEYDYLQRPYTLIPLVSTNLPVVKLTTYEITIKPGVYYQPHPAFAKDLQGNYLYHQLTADEIDAYKGIADFKQTASRELIAEDFVYQIKRLADPKLASPIYGFMSHYINGLTALRDELKKAYQNKKLDPNTKLDLRQYTIAGAEVVDKYTYRITINGNYPQFQYWLAMPFFAPVPWEAVQFYNQAGMEEHNLTLDWYPVGTGPYMLIENNPERRMVMVRNPNFHGQTYPTAGEAADQANGLLMDAGKPIPFVDKIIFTLEKEDIPYWNKFLQGYYDASGISSDSFNSAIDATPNGIFDVSQELRDKGISLQTSVAPSVMYWAFNMLDPTVGGYSEEAKKLRQAITIAFDVEEFISIFLNGRGISANSPIPPGIFGHDARVNVRRNIQEAKALLEAAGYPNGRNKITGEQLTINFEAISTGDPGEKAIFAWVRKQFAKLDIELIIRATDYNRFREKMDNGDAQLFFWGWNADYPDPENFLFMLYGPNSKVKYAGENAANYHNPEFDRLFEQMRTMPADERRTQVIADMTKILQQDAPWIWGYHPQAYVLSHAWSRVLKPNSMANNTMKYIKIDPVLRSKQRLLWNKPIVWPLLLVVGSLLLLMVPAWLVYLRYERAAAKRIRS